MKVTKEFDGKGIEGCILIYPDLDTAVECGPDEDSHIIAFGKRVKCTGTKVVFRIYERDESGHVKKNDKGRILFKDYDIRHHDLQVVLKDGHFYETDEGNFIDYPGLRRYASKTSDSDAP
jgi:hypothetical protein